MYISIYIKSLVRMYVCVCACVCVCPFPIEKFHGDFLSYNLIDSYVNSSDAANGDILKSVYSIIRELCPLIDFAKISLYFPKLYFFYPK